MRDSVARFLFSWKSAHSGKNVSSGVFFFAFDVRWHFAFYHRSHHQILSPCFSHVWRCFHLRHWMPRRMVPCWVQLVSWILPFPEPEKTSMAICRVNFLLQGRAMSLKGGSLGAIGTPRHFTMAENQHGREVPEYVAPEDSIQFPTWLKHMGTRTNRCSQQCDFPRQKVTDLSDWWWTLSWLFFLRSVVFLAQSSSAILSFEKSRSDHFSQGIERIRTVWPSKTDGVETVKDHDQHWRCRI